MCWFFFDILGESFVFFGLLKLISNNYRFIFIALIELKKGYFFPARSLIKCKNNNNNNSNNNSNILPSGFFQTTNKNKTVLFFAMSLGFLPATIHSQFSMRHSCTHVSKAQYFFPDKNSSIEYSILLNVSINRRIGN